MALNFDNITTNKIVSVRAFDRATGSCKFIIDQIKDGTFENGSEKVYGTGAGGARISVLDRNKTAKFSCTNGFLVASMLATQVGTTATDETSYVTPAMEYITVGEISTSVTTTFKAVGTVGAEIKLHMANPDKSLGKEFTQAETASTSAFAYAPDTKTITLPTTGITTGDVLIVFYDYNANAKVISNNSNNFAGEARIVIDVLCKNTCDGTDMLAMFVLPNASIDGNFSIGIGNEPAVHAFSCECITNICSANKKYWDIVIPDGEAT